MEIEPIKVSSLRNNEHFQLNREFLALIMAIGAEELKIKEETDEYQECVEQEDVVLQEVEKSDITEELEEMDEKRDTSYRSAARTNKIALQHRDPAVAKSSKKMAIVFKSYGNIPKKPYPEATSAYYNLVQDLKGPYRDDVQMVEGLTNWVSQLECDNNDFDALYKSRVDQQYAREHAKMKDVRKLTDKAYRKVVRKINALIIVEGEHRYAELVSKFNIFVNKYNLIRAQRAGRGKK